MIVTSPVVTSAPRIFLAVVPMFLAACSGESPGSPPTTVTAVVATSVASTTTTEAGLTAHEKVACARWKEMVAGAHQTSIGDMYGWVRLSIANEAWVDAEGGRVHRYALAMADAIQKTDGTGDSVTQAGRALSSACGTR